MLTCILLQTPIRKIREFAEALKTNTNANYCVRGRVTRQSVAAKIFTVILKGILIWLVVAQKTQSVYFLFVLYTRM